MAKNDHATGKGEKTTTKTNTNSIQPSTPNMGTPAAGAIGTSAKPGEHQGESEQKPLPWFIRAIAKPEWLTVIVTAAYTFVAFLQWRAIRRQADSLDRQIKEAKESSDNAATTANATLKAIKRQARHMEAQSGAMVRQANMTERQMNIMEAQFFQWVEMANWESGEPLLEPGKFGVRVTLSNPTDFPMTIRTGKITLARAWVDDIERSIMEDTFLAPKESTLMEIKFHIEEASLLQYREAPLIFPVKAVFRHFGPLGEKVITNQIVRGVLCCWKGRPTTFQTTDNDSQKADADQESPI